MEAGGRQWRYHTIHMLAISGSDHLKRGICRAVVSSWSISVALASKLISIKAMTRTDVATYCRVSAEVGAAGAPEESMNQAAGDRREIR